MTTLQTFETVWAESEAGSDPYDFESTRVLMADLHAQMEVFIGCTEDVEATDTAA